jgi:hypothetical protein
MLHKRTPYDVRWETISVAEKFIELALVIPPYEDGGAAEGFGQKRLKLLGFTLGKTC